MTKELNIVVETNDFENDSTLRGVEDAKINVLRFSLILSLYKDIMCISTQLQ